MPSGKMRLPACSKNPSFATTTAFAGFGALSSQNRRAATFPAASFASRHPSTSPAGHPPAGGAKRNSTSSPSSRRDGGSPYGSAATSRPLALKTREISRGLFSFTRTAKGWSAAQTRAPRETMRGGRQSRSIGAVCVKRHGLGSSNPFARTRQYHTPGSSGSRSWNSAMPPAS